MKNVRKLGKVIFYAVTLIVFGAGTVFTFMHRYNPDVPMLSKDNILAIAGALFLTVGELALVYAHAMTDSKELWRRIAAYTLALAQIVTIVYAAGTEAMAYMNESFSKNQASLVTKSTNEMTATLKGNKAKERVIGKSQETLEEVVKTAKNPEFTPFLVNFFVGLFTIVTLGLIQPREPWKRRKGNQMTPDLKAKAETKLGFALPEGAKAFDDGKGSSVILKKGREYLGSIPRKDIE